MSVITGTGGPQAAGLSDTIGKAGDFLGSLFSGGISKLAGIAKDKLGEIQTELGKKAYQSAQSVPKETRNDLVKLFGGVPREYVVLGAIAAVALYMSKR